MIGKLVDVKIDEAKQYSLNGTFVKEHQKGNGGSLNNVFKRGYLKTCRYTSATH